jgi:hypothetical protein
MSRKFYSMLIGITLSVFSTIAFAMAADGTNPNSHLRTAFCALSIISGIALVVEIFSLISAWHEED